MGQTCENAPKSIDIKPTPIKPITRTNWSNIVMASSEGWLPKASVISINLNSGEKKEINNGNICRKVQAIPIQKIVLIFIFNCFFDTKYINYKKSSLKKLV